MPIDLFLAFEPQLSDVGAIFVEAQDNLVLFVLVYCRQPEEATQAMFLAALVAALPEILVLNYANDAMVLLGRHESQTFHLAVFVFVPSRELNTAIV